MRRVLASVFCVLLAGGLVPAMEAAAVEPCSSPLNEGGAWSSYGAEVSNTRHQTAEDLIGLDTVDALTVAWVTPSSFATSPTTPVVAGRCVYMASNTGDIAAFDIETGAQMWRVDAAPAHPSKNLVNAVAVRDGVVYANVSEGDGSQAPDAAPIGIALDADTGAHIYQSAPIQFGKPTTSVASAVVIDGRQLVVSNGGDGIPDARPGYAILDTGDGSVLHSRTTIPVHDLDQGYAGGGQWATPAVDPETGYAYNGTANPYSKQKEHRYDNAIIKIDLDRSRPTFGSIVDAYKGNVDQYLEGLDRQPGCDEFGDQIGYHPCCNFSVTCVQLDIDFGASPTIWRNAAGETMVGDLQKSGVFHAVYADTMQHAWTSMLSTVPPGTAGNSSSPANDGEKIYVVANPGILYALDVENGRTVWVAPVADAADYHPVSVANGIVYVVSNHGLLLGYDATNGAPVLARSMMLDTQRACFPLAGGVAIAQHHVLASCDGMVVAYRLGA